MITAVDTNVLLDLLLPSPEWCDRAVAALGAASAEGGLVVSDIVYAETLAHFDSIPDCEDFLRATGIRVERVSPEACLAATRAWTAYRKRGGKRIRILPDFLVGAHAVVQADRLLTRDQRFYRASFGDLDVVAP